MYRSAVSRSLRTAFSGSRLVPASAAAVSRTTFAQVGSFGATHGVSSTCTVGVRSSTTAPVNAKERFVSRHVGPTPHQIDDMLKIVGYKTLDEFIDAVVPSKIRKNTPLNIPGAMSEMEYLQLAQQTAADNQIFRSHIGMGYYNTFTPTVILRNILESPAWYTPYTPYQAEIAQGRLESLLNYQTGICELTGMDVSNGSLLDEGTAAAEAMTMCHSIARGKKSTFLVSDKCHPQTISVVTTRGRRLGINIVVVADSALESSITKDICGALIQYPDTYGTVSDYEGLTKKLHDAGALAVVATDLLALSMLRPPGEWGADIVMGSAQRMGVPMGYGGPHAAFFAVKDEYKRSMPGRIIGVSKDAQGNRALRMALQTREQHIRREKATSNVCTAQALLANIAAFYMIFHGPVGLKHIADRTHAIAARFASGLSHVGAAAGSKLFFDTVHVATPAGTAAKIAEEALKKNINLRVVNDHQLTVAFDETSTPEHAQELLQIFATALGKSVPKLPEVSAEFKIDGKYLRTTAPLSHPIFRSCSSETDVLRYIYRLQEKDLGLQNAMIPLGSCTMKLNSTSEMIPVTYPGFGQLHPFAPRDQAKGYAAMLEDLTQHLREVTGFAAVSLQPNSGAQGEYAGLLAIARYHESRGHTKRRVCLIPLSAHGTNPASAVMAGMTVEPVGCDSHGNIDVADLTAKAEKFKDVLAALMITYPSTHGVFETTIKDICDTVHKFGGLVYMDGANMNAQVGLTSPGDMGADVCHLNLHKTFCIPHGGGGPGMGPIGVTKDLEPFLPAHAISATASGAQLGSSPASVEAVCSAPFGSASILPISWGYIRMMGGDGLEYATKLAILNANYMASRLKSHYSILYTGDHGLVAHEFIIDLRPFKHLGITETDVAKRLLDYSFHAPTMSWPVPGTIMVEPTESESKEELDDFCNALLAIRQEIAAIENGTVDPENNVLKNAPHSLSLVTADAWPYPYTRKQAAYPLPGRVKFWPSVGRVDNAYGDRNLVCSCPPMSDFVEK